ncbi:hypothetical protein LWI29_033826 [Acer saccharum]|uniref:Uncharacterized protein n=1 Tax=Acer saccharum TaxID=4024 RepID=A0AA39RZD4_ACESA|nr:hypothetical protein LWI29_033826 [Acer saccharum]
MTNGLLPFWCRMVSGVLRFGSGGVVIGWSDICLGHGKVKRDFHEVLFSLFSGTRCHPNEIEGKEAKIRYHEAKIYAAFQFKNARSSWIIHLLKLPAVECFS